jgi:hypothetical protein
VTRLAAADIARSKPGPSYDSSSTSTTTVHRRTPSSAVSLTIRALDFADAFQLIRRRSSPCTYSRSEWNSEPDCP